MEIHRYRVRHAGASTKARLKRTKKCTLPHACNHLEKGTLSVYVLLQRDIIWHVGGSSKNGTLCTFNTLQIIDVKDYGMYQMT